MTEEELFPQNLRLNDAVAFQEKLSARLLIEDDFSLEEIKTIGGAIMHTRGDYITVSCATFSTDSDLKRFEPLDKNIVQEKAQFAALPGLESFRDGAVLANVLRGFTKPDLLFIEGHGINHPHRLGIASHVGLALDMPTIAVSRDLIAGKIQKVDGKDAIVENNEIIGAPIKAGLLKLYVSPGHRISAQTAVDIAKKCVQTNYPEPLRIARQNLIESINPLNKLR